MKDKSGKLTFAAPEGMPAPEGKEVGDEFEAPAMFRMEKDGKLCLVAVNGMKLASYKEEAEPDPEEDEFMGGLEEEYASQKGGKAPAESL